MDTAREKVENSLVEKLCHRNGWEYGGEDYDIAVEEVKWFIEQFNKLGYRKVPTEFKVISDERISDRWHYFEMLGDKPKTWHDRLRTLRGICKEQSNDDQKQIAGDYSG